MKKQVLFIHSAGPQGSHAGSDDLVAYLNDALGAKYRVLHPKMPEPENPSYAAWKLQLQSQLASITSDVILVGHSLGGSVLLKFLSEEKTETPIAGLCILGAPYWGNKGWKSTDFALPKDRSILLQIPNIILFHSRDDDVVPFDHLHEYAKNLPFVTVHELDHYGHLFVNGCPDLIHEIRRLFKKHVGKKSLQTP
ncbi:alpha/beta fold hydrolase [Larkinella knui]|uniref:Alpha/beta fold hydrolase n=1 Tax=Larkinella knui TaxID=2025310 RepID=A0A3P1CW19_9BACT|nr:alpha/beta fold hydrolase [Larkinella knui]RRB17388.1 alpha/beta fold hydrolase [Larkinella knui]